MKSFGAFLAMLFLSSGSLWAQGENPIDTGNTAWMITATVLVLMMTLPGLALFYGGLVRSKNVLSVLMHCYAIAALASIMWVVFLYSFAFDEDSGLLGGGWLGGLSNAFLNGVEGNNSNGVPNTVFVMFQLTFAIITPGLIVGAFVERMKFVAVMVFTALWLTLVYAPAVYWVWADGGIMLGWGAIDLAGGIVVHATAGVSALVLAKMIGPRRGFPKQLQPPHSPGLVMIGASLLWVGWFGFNAGSQGGASGAAGMTMLVTHISAATAALVWCLVERIQTGKTGVVGIATGMVAGLATITPASGNVGPMGALLIGLLAGVICYFMCGVVRHKLNIDDSLDVFAVHGVGGILGTIMVAFLGAEGVLGGLGLSENPETGETYSSIEQLIVQLKSLGITIVWSAVATIIIVLIIKKTVGLRVSEEVEAEGLDSAEHGETAYNFDA
ncbi:MAG: ammonium transporter [Akkermansiaceae bacterium]|nr:ammonium transporter [Akkermansiaceae bacterium]MDG1364100.1 ammonium transporter [Akkermansiaceae bacterium]